MEEYGQRWGLILYRTTIPAAALQNGAAELDLGAVVHDYASVYIGGQMAGRMQRTGPANLTLRAPAGTVLEGSLTLDIFVEGMGRQNFGCDAFGAWDYKGLQSKDVRLNGESLGLLDKGCWGVETRHLPFLFPLPGPSKLHSVFHYKQIIKIEEWRSFQLRCCVCQSDKTFALPSFHSLAQPHMLLNNPPIPPRPSKRLRRPSNLSLFLRFARSGSLRS